MIFRYLHRTIILILFCVITLFVRGQQLHFVYLQTENSQPFYVKLNNNVTSSSSLGYLILPKLAEGDYNLTVGFPKKEFPEENFQLSIDKKNQGFLLKNFGDKGWGLFNLQSLSIVMGAGQSNTATTAKNLQNDPFSNMLATVVKDSLILEKPDVVPPPLIQKNDTVSNAGSALNASIDSLTIDQNNQAVSISTITRTLLTKNKDGVEMIYIDKLDRTSDTIRIFIPGGTLKDDKETAAIDVNEKQGNTGDKETKESESSNFQQEKIDSSKQIIDSASVSKVSFEDSPKEKKDSTGLQKNSNDQNAIFQVPDITTDKQEDKIIIDKKVDEELPKVVNFSKVNSDCKAFATNEDFIKLRKKLAGENNNEDMLKEAKKGFKLRCFSTEQIKNLSYLFLDDEGKYQFFDAAYAFSSDSDQYYKLQSQLSDTYYINRFKAMIHK